MLEAGSVDCGPGTYLVVIQTLSWAELSRPSLGPLEFGAGKQAGTRAEVQAGFGLVQPHPIPICF